MFSLRKPQITDLLQGEHHEILVRIGEGCRKSGFWFLALISLKRGKIGPSPRLLLKSNRKSYTRFRSVPKSIWMTLAASLCTVLKHVLLFIYFKFHIQSAFSRQMPAGAITVLIAITALTFRKLKQITFSVIGRRKNMLHLAVSLR